MFDTYNMGLNERNAIVNSINNLQMGISFSYIPQSSSIKEKLFTLPGETIIYPGHGLPTTIEQERTSSYYER